MEKQKVVEEITRIDRLSQLPEAIILHILSLMNTKYAVQTCVLSKRWRGLWTCLPSLLFDNDAFRSSPKNHRTFDNFVLNVLSHRRDFSIHSLRIWHSNSFKKKDCYSPITEAVNYAVRHGVQEIDIDDWDSLTPSLLSSQSLKTLKIKCNFDEMHYNKFLGFQVFSSLTTLHLEHIALKLENDSIDLVSRCVNLEELSLIKCILHGVGEVVEISGPRLVSLTLLDSTYSPLGSCGIALIISAPRLSIINYSDDFIVLPPKLREPSLSLEGCSLLNRVNLQLVLQEYGFLFRYDSENFILFLKMCYQNFIKRILPKTKLLKLRLGCCKVIFMKCNDHASIEIRCTDISDEKIELTWKFGRSEEDAGLISDSIEDALERIGLVEFVGRVVVKFCHSLFLSLRRSYYKDFETFLQFYYKDFETLLQGLFLEDYNNANEKELKRSMIEAEAPSIRTAFELAWEKMLRRIEEDTFLASIRNSHAGDTSANLDATPIADYKSFVTRNWQFTVTRSYHDEVLSQMQWPN